MTSEYTPEIKSLRETIQIIDTALEADDFNEGDRATVERSRSYFEERLITCLQMARISIKSTELMF